MGAQQKAESELDELADELEGESELPGLDGPPPTIDELVADENAEKLLALGAAYLAGTPHLARDEFKALECFEASSRFGHAEAEYLAALGYMDGRGVTANLTEGAKRMRSAAQRGSLRAKVYVANLYEMGVYYQADREKADVWYRNVARAASIDGEPGTAAHDRAMARLGCVRHCLTIVADEALPTKERKAYLEKAKAMGYRHRLLATKREKSTPPDEIETPAETTMKSAPAPTVEESEAAPAEKSEAPAKPEGKKAAQPEPEDTLLGAQWTWGAGLVAFLGASFFVSAASVAGWLAMEGSRALAHAGRALPLVGTMHEAVLFAVVLALGVLPAISAYRGRVVAVGSVAAIAGGVGGHYLWAAHTHLVWDRLAQILALGLGTFLVVLFVLGVLGGTRARVKRIAKKTPRRAD